MSKSQPRKPDLQTGTGTPDTAAAEPLRNAAGSSAIWDSVSVVVTSNRFRLPAPDYPSFQKPSARHGLAIMQAIQSNLWWL